ncbi:hypothetical protein [Stetteria hydrogenophila]
MIDGWIVRAAWGGVDAYWVVKGYEHPEWGVVAVPYRVMGRRLPSRPDPALFPGLEARLDCMGREVPVIPRRAVYAVVDPESALRLRLRDLPEPVRELVEHVEAEGLTGSWAVAAERPGSDVDLITFNRGAYEALRDLAAEGSLKPCPREPKWGPKPPPRAGLLDACYKGVPFTLRILRRREPLPCTARRWLTRWHRGPVELRPTGEEFLVPARYDAYIPGLGWVTLETWHTRYQELPPGVYEARLALYYVDGDGYVASPDLHGGLEPSRGHSLH